MHNTGMTENERYAIALRSNMPPVVKMDYQGTQDVMLSVPWHRVYLMGSIYLVHVGDGSGKAVFTARYMGPTDYDAKWLTENSKVDLVRAHSTLQSAMWTLAVAYADTALTAYLIKYNADSELLESMARYLSARHGQ